MWSGRCLNQIQSSLLTGCGGDCEGIGVWRLAEAGVVPMVVAMSSREKGAPCRIALQVSVP
jgi:hypothetical protein